MFSNEKRIFVVEENEYVNIVNLRNVNCVNIKGLNVKIYMTNGHNVSYSLLNGTHKELKDYWIKLME